MESKMFRRLEVWREAMDLAQATYDLARKLPPVEWFGMASQLQRAAVSIPANIAEGYGRTHRGDYLHQLSIARGSQMELETLLILCARLTLLERSEVLPAWRQAQVVGRMLTKLILALRS